MKDDKALQTQDAAILHICLSKGWGGLEMYPIRIGTEYLKKGYRVYALCLANSQVAIEMKNANIETFEVKSIHHLILSELKALIHWLRQRNVTTVHSHKSRDVLVSALLYKHTKRKSFFTEHMGGKSPKKDFFHQLIYRHLSRIFSISKETYQRNLATLPVTADKITQLWLGISIPNLLAQSEIKQMQQALNVQSTSNIIGCVGRLNDGKGQLDLVKAFKIVLQTHPNSELLLVGGLKENEGADEVFVAKLQQHIQSENLADKVHFLGFRKDTFNVLSAMDIVCIPSFNEAFGLTAIEAMSAQKAIIVSNSGALPEILEDTALYAKAQNSQDLANKIIQFIENSDLRQTKAIAARQRVLKHFSMEKHIDSLLYYYELNAK